MKLPGGRRLSTTPVFDSYWHFAAKRQDLFMRRLRGDPSPWTDDDVIASHRFTNAYRASDRVSQYLIRNVIYSGSDAPEELFFRIMLFKLFNRIETWELLLREVGFPEWRTFDLERYGRVLDREMADGQRLYSAAYIMPSPAFGNIRKHRNHLMLLQEMMQSKAPSKIAGARSYSAVFETLLSYRSLGGFLAFQFAVDLNYSPLTSFSEMEFVVAGPGAKDGIRKCFADTGGLTEADVIRAVADMAESEFNRLGLNFQTLWGRPLQLVDCQNLFCEVDKYARVVHPEWSGESGRTRIKQKYRPGGAIQTHFYPPKWGITPTLPTVAPLGFSLFDKLDRPLPKVPSNRPAVRIHDASPH